jgi:hypothetical protein
VSNWEVFFGNVTAEVVILYPPFRYYRWFLLPL